MGARRSRYPSHRLHRHRRRGGVGQSTRGRADEGCAACSFRPQPSTARTTRGARNQNNRRHVMAVFRSIGAALDYAHALYLDPGHAALQARGMRAGIHIGSVDVVGADIFGTEVDVAARVVDGIEGPEIWLSDQAKRDLERAGARRHSGLQWLSHDGVELKGIGKEKLWSLVPGTEPAGAVPPVSETSAENGPARVEGPARDGLGMTGDEIRPRQFAFGPFRLFPEQQLLLEGESPVRLGGRAR